LLQFCTPQHYYEVLKKKYHVKPLSAGYTCGLNLIFSVIFQHGVMKSSLSSYTFVMLHQRCLDCKAF